MEPWYSYHSVRRNYFANRNALQELKFERPYRLEKGNDVRDKA